MSCGEITAELKQQQYTVPDKTKVAGLSDDPERVLETGSESDRLVAGVDYRRATPEATLLHWLYLSASPGPLKFHLLRHM